MKDFSVSDIIASVSTPLPTQNASSCAGAPFIETLEQMYSLVHRFARFNTIDAEAGVQ